jgi:hypothetical protein
MPCTISSYPPLVDIQNLFRKQVLWEIMSIETNVRWIFEKLGYSTGYQKWYPTNIIMGDIWVNFQGVKCHQSWYLAPWYPKTMLDIKDVDVWLGYQS